MLATLCRPIPGDRCFETFAGTGYFNLAERSLPPRSLPFAVPNSSIEPGRLTETSMPGFLLVEGNRSSSREPARTSSWSPTPTVARNIRLPTNPGTR